MENILAEFRCRHRSEEDEKWIANQVRPADLRLKVLDNNLIIFEFEKDDNVLGTYRLCWNGFRQFAEQLGEWFFEDDPRILVPSCVDSDQAIRCLVHPDYNVSLTIGSEKPEYVFYANRADVLGILDSATRIVNALPTSGCYRLSGKPDETSAVSSAAEDAEEVPEGMTIQEVFANLSRTGHTVH